MEKENLIFYGDGVKALGDGKVAGYLVRFGHPDDVDLEGDYFDPETDYGVEDGARLPVYYQHGMDATLKTRKIGKGLITMNEAGLWMEAQLEMRDEYERAIYEMAEADKLGWSSGAAGHLVERVPIGKASMIKSWPIAEASLTPTPAEPRNEARTVKSLIEPEPVVTEQEQEVKEVEQEEITEEVQKMDEHDEAQLKELLLDISQMSAEAAVKAYRESEPETKAGFDVAVTEDEADRELKGNPFKRGEYFTAVKNAEFYPSQMDKRLLPFKATGLNEAIPSQGGFLVPPEISAGILENMWGTGTVLSFFNPVQVSGNSMTFNAVDETSRADGSRFGGVLGYWLAEAGVKTATKPSFRQIDLKLKKVAALVYATDELLADATALESWIARTVPNELRFQTEAAIVNGDGVGKPLGILQGAALVSATRTNASLIDNMDVARMWTAKLPGLSDYIWLVNPTVWPQLYNMYVGQQPVFMPPGGLSGAQYGNIFGRPVVENEYSPALGTLGDIMLVSPSQYALISKGGVEAASSIHVKFIYDESVFRFVFRVDGQPIPDSAITGYDSQSYSPFVALAAST